MFDRSDRLWWNALAGRKTVDSAAPATGSGPGPLEQGARSHAGSSGRDHAPACSTSTGCSPRRPKCTARPGSRCSTSSSRPATATGTPRSTRATTTTPTSTANPARTACATSWPAAASTCPTAHPDDPPDADSVYGLGNRKNVILLKKIDEDGVEVYEGSVRYLEAAVAAGLRRIVVSSSANTEQVLRVTGLDKYVEGRIDGVTLREQHIAGKPAPDSYIAGAHLAGVAVSAAAVFEDALAGVASGRAGNFGYVVGVNRTGQAEALKRQRRRRRRRRPGRTLGRRARRPKPMPPVPMEEPRDQPVAIPGRAVARTRTRPRHVDAGPIGIGVRAGQRPRRACAATSTKATRTHCPVPTSTRSSSSARCPTPRPATATPSRGRRSSTSPTASSSACWSTTNRSTCATARSATTSGCSTCAPV